MPMSEHAYNMDAMQKYLLQERDFLAYWENLPGGILADAKKTEVFTLATHYLGLQCKRDIFPESLIKNARKFDTNAFLLDFTGKTECLAERSGIVVADALQFEVLWSADPGLAFMVGVQTKLLKLFSKKCVFSLLPYDDENRCVVIVRCFNEVVGLIMPVDLAKCSVWKTLKERLKKMDECSAKKEEGGRG